MEHALHHKARIHARAQKATNLNIGNLVRAHRIREHFLYTIGPFVKRKRFINLVLELIVARRFKRARSKVPREPASRLQLIHAFEQGFLVGKVLIRQIIRNFFAHNFLHETRMIQETLDFRAKQKLPIFVVVVEGLDAENVARAEQLARLRIPNDEREHAAQLIKHAAAPFLVAVKDGFGVGMRGKRVTRRQQLFAKLLVVVDFAVEHNDFRAIFVGHGLASALKVDNRQATMRQRHEIVHIKRGVVGAAMRNTIAHQLRHAQGVTHRIGNSKTGKTAHISSLSVKVLMPPGRTVPVPGLLAEERSRMPCTRQSSRPVRLHYTQNNNSTRPFIDTSPSNLLPAHRTPARSAMPARSAHPQSERLPCAREQAPAKARCSPK